jgi:hypothetical protein
LTTQERAERLAALDATCAEHRIAIADIDAKIASGHPDVLAYPAEAAECHEALTRQLRYFEATRERQLAGEAR